MQASVALAVLLVLHPSRKCESIQTPNQLDTDNNSDYNFSSSSNYHNHKEPSTHHGANPHLVQDLKVEDQAVEGSLHRQEQREQKHLKYYPAPDRFFDAEPQRSVFRPSTDSIYQPSLPSTRAPSPTRKNFLGQVFQGIMSTASVLPRGTGSPMNAQITSGTAPLAPDVPRAPTVPFDVSGALKQLFAATNSIPEGGGGRPRAPGQPIEFDAKSVVNSGWEALSSMQHPGQHPNVPFQYEEAGTSSWPQPNWWNKPPAWLDNIPWWMNGYIEDRAKKGLIKTVMN